MGFGLIVGRRVAAGCVFLGMAVGLTSCGDDVAVGRSFAEYDFSVEGDSGLDANDAPQGDAGLTDALSDTSLSELAMDVPGDGPVQLDDTLDAWQSDTVADVIAVPCPALVAPAHGSVPGGAGKAGDLLTFSCDPGYAIVGLDTLTCQEDGNWSDTPPTCEPITCPDLVPPANGQVNAPSSVLGSTATYSCAGGFAMSGSASRTCEANGKWSGTAPTCLPANSCADGACKNGSACADLNPGYSCTCVAGWTGANCDLPVDCGALDGPANGKVEVSATTNGGTATYSCVGGYVLSGNGVRTCTSSGTWSGSAPTCDPVTCQAGSAPANGSVAPSTPTYGAEAVYSCNPGYLLNGPSARVCQVDGTLAGVAPLCDPVTCTTAAPENGQVSDTSVQFPGVVNYSCNSGFQIGSGDAKRTCGADGLFTGTAPVCVPATGGCDGNPCSVHATGCTPTGASTFVCACEPGWSGSDCGAPVDCGGLDNPANGQVNVGATTLSNTASYTCVAGFEPSSTATRTCQTDGTWSGVAPTCNAITCGGLTAPTNGSLSGISVAYPGSVTYACDGGYILAGATQRECQADGSFSGIAPSCNPVDCGALQNPVNGSVAGPTTFGSTAVYGCGNGYLLVGNANTTCTADGTWSSPAPTCVTAPTPCAPNPCVNGGTCTPGDGTAYTCGCIAGYSGSNCETPQVCGGAVAPTHGSVSAASATLGQSVTYACDPGYGLVGGTQRVCQADGNLDGSAPTCEAVVCSGAVAPAGGSVSAGSVSYPDVVTYSCDQGYTLSGATTRPCQTDATFGGTAPTCVPVSCGTLDPPSNGGVNAPTITYGASGTYSCNNGYSLTGSPTRTCDVTGQWTGAAPTCTLVVTGCADSPCKNGGTCTPVGVGGFSCACTTGWAGNDCASPVTCVGAVAPGNGGVSASSAVYGASVTYSCDAGYTLSGATSRICQANGTFDGAAPTCAAVLCTGASAPVNGSVSATSAAYPTSVTYGCNPGYTLTGNGGSPTRTCLADTSFSGTAPTCTPVTCTASAPVNGGVSAPSATFGNGVTFTCNQGHTLVGSASATCTAAGSFDNPVPTCNPVNCGTLTAPSNGGVTVPSTTYGSIATYGCNQGYGLNGGTTRSCGADGNWTGAAPTCTPTVTPCTPNPCLNGGSCTVNGASYTCACAAGYGGANCGTPVTCSTGVSAPTNGTVSATSATYGNSVNYQCDSGYTLTSGSASRTCQADGTFSGNQPTCGPVTCSGAVAPQNGGVSASSATFGNSVTYTCNSGYAVSGSTSRSCQANGTFVGSAPTCTPVDCGTPTLTNGKGTAATTTFGSSVTYSCNVGYGLVGTATGTCQANATWTTPASCAVDCGTLTAPTNGSVTYNPNTYLGGTATYACNANATMTGSPTRTCTATGWNGAAPTCYAEPLYCDVVYHLADGNTQYGNFHVYVGSVPIVGSVNKTVAVGKHSLTPAYGNNPYTTMPDPLTVAGYPQGWARIRYPANAAGTAPIAGAISLIELYLPVNANNLPMTGLGPNVTIALDGTAGIFQTTTTGCTAPATRCLALSSGAPVIDRKCTTIATGTVVGTTLSWDTCSINAPSGNTGTPNATQLNFPTENSVASPGDTGCVTNMTAYGGVKCVSGGLAGCGAAGTLTTTPTASIWDEKLPAATLSSATYSTATLTIPEFIIPEGSLTTYLGARVSGATVYKVECGKLAALTCDEN